MLDRRLSPADSVTGAAARGYVREWVRELITDRNIAPAGPVGAQIYETAAIMPRGDDGGFAERSPEAARRWRQMSDT